MPGPELAEHVRVARAAPGQNDAGNLAQDVWKDVFGAAGLGIVNLCWTLSPEVVVVGGGVGLNWALNEPILRDVLDRLGPPFEDIDLAPAALGDDAGLAGAAAWQEAIGRPTPLRDERSGEPGPSGA